MTEKHRFQVLLHELCQGIQEPVVTNGRKPIPIRDRVYAIVTKVYSTFSARRFACELNEAHKRGHLSRPVHLRWTPFFGPRNGVL
jgi:hypothetical protein